MDPVAAARRLLDALGTPMAMGLVTAPAAEFLLRARRPDEVLDVVMKRNLVFVSWRQGAATGTWLLSFDRDGRLIAWTEA